MATNTTARDQMIENPSRWRTIKSRLPYPFGDEPLWPDGHTRVHEKREVNPRVWRAQVIDTLDRSGFDFRVFMVSASGFLTDSYALFATNAILPILAILYWPERKDGGPELYINVVTLAGSVVGQILFGWLADKIGRRKLYGLELVLVIFATLGMAQASSGLYNNMDILSWIMFYRFFLGMGIGAEYPLSAIITAEFASTESRARMLAAVFLMQPLGQILAAGIGWAVLTGLMSHRGLTHFENDNSLNTSQRQMLYATLDSVWRWVIGVGCVPALLAIIWRFSIPESPRYTMDVEDDLPQAVAATRRQFPRAFADSRSSAISAIPSSGNRNTLSSSIGPSSPAMRALSPVRSSQAQSKPTFYEFLVKEGNWRYLAATCICWFLLDFCFYALGINSPRPLAALWAPTMPTVSVTTTIMPNPQTTTFVAFTNTLLQVTTTMKDIFPTPTVEVMTYAADNDAVRGRLPDSQNPWDPTVRIFDELSNNARDYIWTIAVSSLAGSFLLIFLINHISRKKWLVWSFFILGGWFVVLGITLPTLEFKGGHWANVVIYALCQFFFNLGECFKSSIMRFNPTYSQFPTCQRSKFLDFHCKYPATFHRLTFIITPWLQIPAEIFPTRFRATCYGLAAASGKIGAIIISVITQHSQLSTSSTEFDRLLACFSIPLVIGGVVAWIWIPELQTEPTWSDHPRLMVPPLVPSKGLEVLAKGWRYATGPNHFDPVSQVQTGEAQNLGFRRKFGSWSRNRGQQKDLREESHEGGLPLSVHSSTGSESP